MSARRDVQARLGAPLWLAVIVSLWGMCAMMLAAMRGAAHFLLLRVLLGVFEAGTFPGVWCAHHPARTPPASPPISTRQPAQLPPHRRLCSTKSDGQLRVPRCPTRAVRCREVPQRPLTASHPSLHNQCPTGYPMSAAQEVATPDADHLIPAPQLDHLRVPSPRTHSAPVV